MEIQGIVAGYVDAGKFVDVPKAKVLFKMLWQIDGGPHVKLMTRALPVRVVACGI
jgi:hypothetical protein